MVAWTQILRAVGAAFCGTAVLIAEEAPSELQEVQQAVKQRLAADDRAGAVTLFREFAAAQPDDLEVQLQYADFIHGQAHGDTIALQLAVEILEAALQKSPRNPDIIRRLHPIYQNSARPIQAAELLDQLDPENVKSALLFDSITRGASEAEAAANREKTDRRHLQSVAAHPEDVQLAHVVFEYFHQSGRSEIAIEVLEKHRVAAPLSLDLQIRLGVLLFATKQNDRGEAVLKRVLEMNPQEGLAHEALAKFYRLNGKPELARQHASEFLKLRQGTPADVLKLATEFLAVADPGAARLLLEQAVEDHPGHFELLQKLAIASRRDPATQDGAAHFFREAEAARPKAVAADPAFLVESAEAWIAQGESKAAEEQLRAAIRAYPPEARAETATALRRLALFWESENRNLEPAKALRQRAEGLVE